MPGQDDPYYIFLAANSDGYLEISPDGFPRYYLKKPNGPYYVHPSVSGKEQLRRIKLMRESENMKLLRWFASISLFIFIKLLDHYLVYRYLLTVPRSCRIISCLIALYNFRLVITAMFYKKRAIRFPVFKLFFRYSTWPLAAILFVLLFFKFDDMIPGPMYKNPWMQQFHLNVKENVWVLIERPYLIGDYYP